MDGTLQDYLNNSSKWSPKGSYTTATITPDKVPISAATLALGGAADNWYYYSVNIGNPIGKVANVTAEVEQAVANGTSSAQEPLKQRKRPIPEVVKMPQIGEELVLPDGRAKKVLNSALF